MGNFSSQIKLILKAENLTQTGLATRLGLSQGVISEFTSGTREPSKEFLLGLPKLGISLDWFLTGKGEMFLSSQEKALEKTQEGYRVPLLRQKVSCGRGQNWVDDEIVQEYIDIFTTIPRLSTNKLYALLVEGSSMIGAGIQDGDYVLFDSHKGQILKDGIYVFSLDKEVYCKRLEFDRISSKIKIYSVRVADLEKAELLTTIKTDEPDQNDRLTIFGRVVVSIHPHLSRRVL